jgi:hypothetical protein
MDSDIASWLVGTIVTVKSDVTAGHRSAPDADVGTRVTE